MTEPQPGAFGVLPCGCTVECVMEGERKVVKYVPCSATCDYYLRTVGEAGRHGKPAERRES